MSAGHALLFNQIAVAVTSLKRAPALPQVPAMSEALPGFEVVGWYGLLTPAGLPAPLLNTLHTEIVRIVQQPAFREQVSSEGTDVVTSTPEKFREFLKADVAKWAQVVKAANIRIE